MYNIRGYLREIEQIQCFLIFFNFVLSSAPVGVSKKLKYHRTLPEMKRSRGVHSPRAQEHYTTPRWCEVRVFKKHFGFCQNDIIPPQQSFKGPTPSAIKGFAQNLFREFQEKKLTFFEI